MHKRTFNEASIKVTIAPAGPILIKAGTSGSDPTKPDMSFVRTFRNGQEAVYLPGSSLKGVLRSHCENLARTVDSDVRRKRHSDMPIACDPLDDRRSCGARLEKNKLDTKDEWTGARKHKESCFVCRIFGNTSFASQFRITDAYLVGASHTEERNGVAIDRVFGSVAVGPFNYETVTAGEFQATLTLKNFSLAQLGLLSLALRDLSLERVRLGFAKSRGLGLINMRVDALVLRYPLCELEGPTLQMPAGKRFDASKLYGVGAFVDSSEGYGYPVADEVRMPEGYTYLADGWMGAEVSAPTLDAGGVDWQPLGRACVPLWKAEVENGEER